MRKTALPVFLSLTALAFISLIFLHKATSVNSASASHLVISEIQVAGANAADEFVELYNPTASDVDLTGWRLSKKTQPATTETSLIASISGTIPSHGFFLITSDKSLSSGSADLVYEQTSSRTIAANNTLLLYSNAGSSLVDKVGFGTALDTEATAAATPSSGQSLERKANSSSTTESMSSGADEDMGNSEDTDNNENDFVIRETPQPQNSQSNIEPEEATPTSSPSSTPSSTPSATPTASPTSSPTSTPTASPTSSPSATPSAAPNPFLRFNVVCQVKVRTLSFGFFRIQFPQLFCKLEQTT